MSILSKSEIHYLQGQKQVSKSYGYKLKSVIKKKVTNLLDKEIPLLSSLLSNLDLTDIDKGKSPFKATIPGSNPGRSIAINGLYANRNKTMDIIPKLTPNEANSAKLPYQPKDKSPEHPKDDAQTLPNSVRLANKKE
jgi:hypothetical protein